MKRKTLLVLGLGALMTLASCQGSGDSGVGKYTLRSYVSGTPTNWNPHTWEDSGYDEVAGYTEIGFVDYTYDPANPGAYQLVYELADGISDVSDDESIVNSEFKKKWGIKDGEGGRVWKIDLNHGAKFASGLAINAQTYIDSMELLLNHEYKNYRANNYYSGDTSIVNAFHYYNSGETNLVNNGSVTEDPENGVTAGTTQYLDFANSPLFGELINNTSYEDWATGDYAAYGVYYFSNSAGENLLTKYAEATELTDAIMNELLETVVSGLFTDDASNPLTGDDLKAELKTYLCSRMVSYSEISMSDVGLQAIDDYTLLYITEYGTSQFYFNISASSVWLVNPELYRSLTDTKSGVKTSAYGTASAGAEGYDSFGPYKLSSFQEDKQFKFTRNENWYGWTDGKHEGQFQTTDIVVDVYKEHASALLAFEKGDIDSIALEQADLVKYGYSDYLSHVDDTYTMRLVFDSNLSDLKKLESTADNGKNKQILSEYEFRKAISLAINRKRFNAEGTAGNKEAYALFNSLYIYDAENDPNSVYRNSDEAKKAVTDLYGMEYGEGKEYPTLDAAYNAVTGLDVAQAKTLFTTAYNNAIKKGTYTDGQEIELEIGYYDATTNSNSTQTRIINECIATATKDTPLEGKITFKGKSFTGDETRYDAIGDGNIEIANCAWGGAALYPFSTMRVYCDPDYTDINEARSWDPTTQKLTISYDWDGDGVATEETDTYQGWSVAIGASKGRYYTADVKLKLHVLATLENSVLNMYNFAVVGSYATVSLRSMKISYVTDTYNFFYGFGGIRYMSYNFDDAGWAKFVSSEGGALKYN